jgi:gas vesicle protein GvpA/GvpJ/GvpM family
MSKRAIRPRRTADVVLETPESTVLDVIDQLLNKGVVATGDLTLGVAGIDLIYLRLSALLCAADRVLPRHPDAPRRRSRHRPPGAKQPR